ncbi:flavin reductase family protein [Arthrobacter bambusae]|uniref:flavin reductase family protein n=1 Tax=Arthrobacter bambusae TaxID=1338426 RepID=UPI00277E1C57|nr:flavin reductase family protein [Arthrobacter bambusae]MDQ0028623.1 flavin reductase (DIM6/NTAB) family NADH-FMN oxidoreductase RutF [Arthrobacter bambusae]MDQ0096583.1 flavin reductase (DIM6/NTAB) family NADH-FMN oxidoreductase RutF [Arthrobacter bambusae]
MTVTTVQHAVSGAELRRAVGHWTTGISVITTRSGGTLAGLVSNSFTDVPRIECRPWQRVDAGDHVILIGETVSVSDPENFRPLTNHAYWAK